MLNASAAAAIAPWLTLFALGPAIVCALAALLALRASSPWRITSIAAAIGLGIALPNAAALALTSTSTNFFRTDFVTVVVSLLVAFIGWVIQRYSRNYLDGESRQSAYAAKLLSTLASVHVVVIANDLLILTAAWCATSLFLHQLLTFYQDRRPAVLAAHKKFVLSRVADAAMLVACALLWSHLGTLRIDQMMHTVQGTTNLAPAVQFAGWLIAGAAVIKCAQLPFHGWLIQVMEAPTPVSALLHAGVVNLGGLVLLRVAPLISQTPAASATLVVAGVLTAVIAALVMTTRVSIKVSLAWSTCAQMGFMLMQCGLGLWEMVLLHLVAHSVYKANAFLRSGEVVRDYQIKMLSLPEARPSLSGLCASAVVALCVVGSVATVFAINVRAQPALGVMAVVFALALAPLLRTRGPDGIWRAFVGVGTTAAITTLYLSLHAALVVLIPFNVPATSQPWWALVLGAFAALYFVQSLIAARPDSRWVRTLYPWFYGGLFLDQRFSRILFKLWPAPRAGLRAQTVRSGASRNSAHFN